MMPAKMDLVERFWSKSEGYTFTELAEMFGVSDVAVRKWVPGITRWTA